MAKDNLIPIFPLSTVLIPGVSLPLHIFESRYRQLVNDLLALQEPDRIFGVIAIKAGWEVGENNQPQLYELGTIAKVRKVKHLADGKFDLATTGADRFKIINVVQNRAPYLMAQVELLDPVEDDADPALITSAQRSYERYLKTIGEPTESIYAQLPSQGSTLANLLNATLSGNLIEQQAILELSSARAKLNKLITIFNREAVLLESIPSIPAPYLTGVSISLN